VAQTVTIGEQKVSPESLKFSATPTPKVQNPSDSTALFQSGKFCNLLMVNAEKRDAKIKKWGDAN